MDPHNYLQTCRLCLASEQSIGLFSEYQKSVRYADVASSLILIELQPQLHLPSMICMECTSKLILFHKFRIKCTETNQIFLDYLQTIGQTLFKPESDRSDLNSNCTDDLITETMDDDKDEDMHKSNDLIAEESEDNTEYLFDGGIPTECPIDKLLAFIEPDKPQEVEQIKSNGCQSDTALSDECGQYDENKREMQEQEEYLEEAAESFLADDAFCSAEDDDFEQITTSYSVVYHDVDLHLEQSSESHDNIVTSMDHDSELIVDRYDSESQQSAENSIQERQTKDSTAFYESFEELETDAISTHQEPLAKSVIFRKAPVFKCKECDQQFSRKSSLDQHWKTRHLGIKDFTCDICAQHFTRKSHVLFHMRIHRNDRPHTCPECSKSFVKLSDLARHRLVHSHERNFECKVCRKRFKRPADVVTHMLTHTGQKPYRCQVDAGCNKSYTSHTSLKKHIMNMHHTPVEFMVEPVEYLEV